MKSNSSVVKLGLLQTSCSADPRANLAKTLAFAERAAKQGQRLATMRVDDGAQALCNLADGRLPVDGLVAAIGSAAQRRREAVSVVHAVRKEKATPVPAAATRKPRRLRIAEDLLMGVSMDQPPFIAVAAWRTAARIRGYVMQRQRLPVI